MKNKYETNYSIKDRANVIKDIASDSIASDIGIKKGYKLLSINNTEIKDILDYKFLISDEYLEVSFLNLNNEEEIYEIEKEEYEDLGLIFETELIDKPKNCHNKCIFCFMEQLPKDVRDTLIFKDDDYRLSFFSGNYITLTNMKEEDIDRIIKYRISPINISLHTTNEEVRCMMLNNRFAGKVLKYIDKLYEAGINMNLQIVLCKDINDKEILYKTLEDVTRYMPMIQSICIVPVGISKYREGLYELKPILKEDCLELIPKITSFQKRFKKDYGTNLVYISDEFYLKAGLDIPKYKEYEDFCQLENGVGMIAVFEDEFKKVLRKIKIQRALNKKTNSIKIVVLTGKITYEYITQKAKELSTLFENLNVEVRYVENNHFGTDITVTGLIVGKDILNTIKDLDKDTYIMIPDVCLKEDEEIFLDDVTLKEIKDEYTNIIISETSANGFANSIYDLYYA